LWKILLSNMSRPETFGMTLVNPNLIRSMMPAHVGVKDRCPLKKWWFLHCSLV